MARKLRSQTIQPGSPNHIIARGNNRRRLFSYRTDYRRYLVLLERAAAKHQTATHALVLMANHIHDVRTPPTVEAASKTMKSCLQAYASYRNQRRETSGKLFEQRYFSEPIIDERQLAITVCYVEANPIRAGLVDDPRDYPWSTYALRAGYPGRSAIPRRMWTPEPWYLSLAPTAKQRASVYRDVFWDYLRTGERPDHGEVIDELEEVSSTPYTRRLLRPDNSRASEPEANCTFGRKSRVISGTYDPGE